MVEFRVIVGGGGGGKPWRNLETDAAWRARFATDAQRRQQEYARIAARIAASIAASCDRIEARLQAMVDHLDGRPLKGRPTSAENAHIRAITHEAAHRQRWSEAEPEPEPALRDVPLHQRGFGVMEDPP